MRIGAQSVSHAMCVPLNVCDSARRWYEIRVRYDLRAASLALCGCALASVGASPLNRRCNAPHRESAAAKHHRLPAHPSVTR